MTEIHVTVDDQLCAASALCQRIAPSIFDLPDDADWAIVLAPTITDGEQIALAREAMDSCPTEAIVIEET